MADRPSGYPANPQALAIASQRIRYNGHPELGRDVDVDTWLTPRFILDQLGPFDMDPCAAEVAPNWVADRFFTIQDDGLRNLHNWSGRVFMNPPFSCTARWLEAHAQYGRGISLVPATVESEVWRKYVWIQAKAILLLHGRTRFCNPDGSSTTGRPLRSIALIAWDQDEAEVLARTTMAGTLLREWRRQ